MKRSRGKKTAIIFASIVINYLIIEYFIWRPLLPYVPVSLHSELGRLKALAQSSKDSYIPEDYILIIGDSYAEGLGDWLMQTIGDTKPKHHTAHVIHEQSGRDVLSFGFRGGYPGHSYSFETTRNFHGITQYAAIGLKHPKDVVVYFNELNDINDELISAKIWLHPSKDLSLLADRRKVREIIFQRGADGQASIEKRWHVLRNAHMFDTFTKLVKLIYRNVVRGLDPLRASLSGFVDTGEYKQNWSRYETSNLRINWKSGTLKYPENSVEPFAFHSADEIRHGMYVFKGALEYLRSYFPNANLWVAYIPTPVGVYTLQNKSISLRDRIRYPLREETGPPTPFTTEHLAAQSQRICDAVAQTTLAVGARFIDTRTLLRERAHHIGYLHGPNDPAHLNKAGYTALAESIMAGITSGGSKMCDNLEPKTSKG